MLHATCPSSFSDTQPEPNSHCLLICVGDSQSGQCYPIASSSILVKGMLDRSSFKQGELFCWQEMGPFFGCCKSASLIGAPNCDSLMLAGGCTKEAFHHEINIKSGIIVVNQNIYNYRGWPSQVCCSLIDVDGEDSFWGWTSLGENHGVLKSIETLLRFSSNFFICLRLLTTCSLHVPFTPPFL